MKKLLIVVGLALVAGSVYASCMGPFCFDDTGAYIVGILSDGNGSGTINLTVSQINTAAPRAKGQKVFCTNCQTFNTFLGGLCLSTGTVAGSYAQISSATAVSACR